MRRSLCVIALVMIAKPALAASFCAQGPGIPEQCIYDDIVTCQKDAAHFGGACTLAPGLLSGREGQGRFCVVDSAMAVRCVYPDPDSCAAEAQRSNSVCVLNPSYDNDKNPFRYDLQRTD